MNSPYKGKFRISQIQHAAHDGLDMVGVDSKSIYSTVAGRVERAGWENAVNKKQGFGQYVRIKKEGSGDRYYFGHLSKISVKVGDVVKIGQLLGTEGATGNSTGSHLHYCCRIDAVKGKQRNIYEIIGIANKIGVYGSLGDKDKDPKEGEYFKKYSGKSESIVDSLKAIGADSSYAYRKKIAVKNSISGYAGTAKQNLQMLELLKKGRLLKP